MRNPEAVYRVNEFIDIKEHPLFKVLNKYFKYGLEFDYTCKANECILQLSKEVEEDPEIKKLIKFWNLYMI